MITKQDKKEFKFCVIAQVKILEELNKAYSKNLELFKVLIDINLEHIENLQMLIGES